MLKIVLSETMQWQRFYLNNGKDALKVPSTKCSDRASLSLQMVFCYEQWQKMVFRFRQCIAIVQE